MRFIPMYIRARYRFNYYLVYVWSATIISLRKKRGVSLAPALEEQYSVRLVLITASVTGVSSFSLQMGSFAIGTVAATAASLIFTALLASGDAALGKFFLKLEPRGFYVIMFWW